MAFTSAISNSAQQNFRPSPHGLLNGSLSTDTSSSGRKLNRPLDPFCFGSPRTACAKPSSPLSVAIRRSSVLWTMPEMSSTGAELDDWGSGGHGLRMAGEPSGVGSRQ